MHTLLLIAVLAVAALAAGCADDDPEVCSALWIRWDAAQGGCMKISELENILIEGLGELIRRGDDWKSADDALDQVIKACFADISDMKGQAAILIDRACYAFGEGDFRAARQFAREAMHH